MAAAIAFRCRVQGCRIEHKMAMMNTGVLPRARRGGDRGNPITWALRREQPGLPRPAPGHQHQAIRARGTAAMQGMSPAEWETFFREHSLAGLLAQAGKLRDAGHGDRVSYSRKVFIPLTQLCRDVCHYCTFAKSPRELAQPLSRRRGGLAIARAGQLHGCNEALFTLGDKPELRYARRARRARELGYATHAVDYLEAMCRAVLRETGAAAPPQSRRDVARTTSPRCAPSASRKASCSRAPSRAARASAAARIFGSPDKHPAVRLATIRRGGRARRAVHDRPAHRHRRNARRAHRVSACVAGPARAIRAHAGNHHPELSRQAGNAAWRSAPEPDARRAAVDDRGCAACLRASDEHPGAAESPSAGYSAAARCRHQRLGRRLAGHPRSRQSRSAMAAARRCSRDSNASCGQDAGRAPAGLSVLCATDAALAGRGAAHRRCCGRIDADGYARDRRLGARRGTATRFRRSYATPRASPERPATAPRHRSRSLDKALRRRDADEDEIVRAVPRARDDFDAVCAAADELRRERCGDLVRYVVNRNINYTNVCSYRCQLLRLLRRASGTRTCAARPTTSTARGVPASRAARHGSAARRKCACRAESIPTTPARPISTSAAAVKEAAPQMHVHAFSPLEILAGREDAGHLARGVPAAAQARRARNAARHRRRDPRRRGSRASLCPDKLKTRSGCESCAPRTDRASARPRRSCSATWRGPSTGRATCSRSAACRRETGGFTEFVPLPFVHMEAPMYHKGWRALGPTLREAVLMHAVARLVLHPLVPNIQVSWVKMGRAGARACLRRRRQRPGRDAHERKHLPRRRRFAWPGAAPARDGRADPAMRSNSSATYHDLRAHPG